MQDNWHALIKFMKRASVPTTKLDADGEISDWDKQWRIDVETLLILYTPP